MKKHVFYIVSNILILLVFLACLGFCVYGIIAFGSPALTLINIALMIAVFGTCLLWVKVSLAQIIKSFKEMKRIKATKKATKKYTTEIKRPI